MFVLHSYGLEIPTAFHCPRHGSQVSRLIGQRSFFSICMIKLHWIWIPCDIFKNYYYSNIDYININIGYELIRPHCIFNLILSNNSNGWIYILNQTMFLPQTQTKINHILQYFWIPILNILYITDDFKKALFVVRET